MPRVICDLPNASDEISGVKFHKLDDGRRISDEIDEEQANLFASIPGYELDEEEQEEETPPPPPPAPEAPKLTRAQQKAADKKAAEEAATKKAAEEEAARVAAEEEAARIAAEEAAKQSGSEENGEQKDQAANSEADAGNGEGDNTKPEEEVF